MHEKEFLDSVRSGNKVDFDDLMSIIDSNYIYTAAAFVNGELSNGTDENQGSAKLFCFAATNQLSEEETLNCFGEYYQEVLQSPSGDSHKNIRNFMIYGWEGLKFETPVLIRK